MQETKSLHVLVAEKHGDRAAALQAMLRDSSAASFESAHVGTVAEISDSLDREPPDVILLDLALADDFGVEALAQDRVEEMNLPIILLADPEDAAPASEIARVAGKDCLIRGQFDAQLLEHMLLHAVERHRLQVELRRWSREHRRVEADLRRAARVDRLTRLPSRAGLTDEIDEAIKHSRRTPGYRFAVFFLDLDRFKFFNDGVGHELGDVLLQKHAARLRDNLHLCCDGNGTANGHMVARLGGDEFGMLLGGISDVDHAMLAAERIQDVLADPHFIAGHEVISTASIGVVVGDGRYRRPEQVIRDAGTAMYHAKAAGRARSVLFDGRMREELVEKLQLEEDLRRAIADQAFTVQYQPIVALESGGLIGFEALLRWWHPQRGNVSPLDFIPLAEEVGLIVPIGRWVLREACRRLKSWQESYPQDPPLTINVNLSKRELSEPALVDTVQEAIAEAGIDPGTLHLEITESMIMDDLDNLIPVLGRLRDLGIQLCMDDFGTGHSSMHCLHRFPINVLKIDQKFTRNMSMNRQYAAVMHAIITLAHNLDLIVVAEGVEDGEGQLAQLQALECDQAQGYFFSKPLSREDALVYLRRAHGLAAA